MEPKLVSSPVRIGVVGCGGVAQIIHLPALARLKEVEIKAICDIDIRKASIVANRFEVAHIFDDIEEMFARCELDAVFILTPNNMHLPMSLIALKHGAHLFIEKPAARNRKEAQRIEQAAQKNSRHVMVGMHTRFRHDIRVIKDYLNNQALGEIFFIKTEWLQARFQAIKQPWLLNKNISGGGVLMDLGIQVIDAISWIANHPRLESVKVHSHQINESLEVEDFCSICLSFAGNLTISCLVSWNFPIEHDRFFAEVFGTSGSLTLNPLKVKKLSQGKAIDLTPTIYDSLNRQDIFKMAYEREIRHFIDFLLGKEAKLESSISEAVSVLAITDWIYESLKKNREIIIQPEGG